MVIVFVCIERRREVLRKKSRKVWNALIMACVMLCMALPVHAESVSVDQGERSTRSTNSASSTVTDNEGNKYSVSGICIRNGKSASVYTGFEVKYYFGGTMKDKERVDNYTKSLKAVGSVTLSGGGRNTIGGTADKTGKDGSYKPSQDFLYNVTMVTGTHSFSCNGASWGVSTYY